MTVKLDNPNREAFDNAITTAGGGVICQEWKDSAWEACNTWISGILHSSPYGHPTPERLRVFWEWKDGDLSLTVMKK